MSIDFELDASCNTTPTSGWGGSRKGAGRKKGYSPKKARELEVAEVGAADDPEEVTSTALKKAKAVARKEEALAGLNELELKIKSGEYLSRAAYREASATLLAELAQGLRSLPDTLERKFGLSPEALLHVERTIDEAMQAVADGLELFAGSDPE